MAVYRLRVPIWVPVVVVLVVVVRWCRWCQVRRYPPLDSEGWDDKGGWNAEIFFRV